MTNDKPRVWWLYDVFTQDHGEILVAFKHHKNIKGSIEVVEASKLDKANARIQELEKENDALKAQLAEAVSALEKIAASNHGMDCNMLSNILANDTLIKILG